MQIKAFIVLFCMNLFDCMLDQFSTLWGIVGLILRDVIMWFVGVGNSHILLFVYAQIFELNS